MALFTRELVRLRRNSYKIEIDLPTIWAWVEEFSKVKR